ncbi:MAG: hypothetical protein NTY06_01665 [Candidatus Gottesmanbacteria bacterium]|nr:hypothetical protein [Candidatus Gottesmanbacteria bacterium]
MKKFKPTLTLADINWLLDSFKRIFVTKDEFKKYTDKVLEKLDLFVGDIKTKREEQTLHENKHDEIEERVSKIEKHLHFPITP